MSRNLCRGWTAENIRELVLRANEDQQAVLLQIADNPRITIYEITENLGWDHWHKARGQFVALGKLSRQIGVKEPGTKKDSWPFVIDERGGYSRYTMPPEVAEIVHQIC